MSTPSERRLTGRLAAYTSWANTSDRTARTQPARDALMRKFELQVDPDGTLDPAERALRAEAAKKAYYTALALKSAKARRKRAAKPKPKSKGNTTKESDPEPIYPPGWTRGRALRTRIAVAATPDERAERERERIKNTPERRQRERANDNARYTRLALQSVKARRARKP